MVYGGIHGAWHIIERLHQLGFLPNGEFVGTRPLRKLARTFLGE
jgi:hypothetical protein